VRSGARPSEPRVEAPAEATELVLFDGERELRRIPIQGSRDAVTEIPLD